MATKPKTGVTPQPVTDRQAAAILELYVTQRLSYIATAGRLHIGQPRVRAFLVGRGLLRTQGCAGSYDKLTPTILNQLKDELPTTPNAVLARKYAVSRERIRQVRQKFGYSAGKVIFQEWSQRIRREREAQQQLARQHRLAAKQAFIERLSQLWKTGMSARDIAAAEHRTFFQITRQIMHCRAKFPDKFPYACARGGWVRPRRPYRPHGPQSAAAQAAHQQRLRAYWEHQLPALNQLSQQWKAGRPVRAIAAELGIAPDTVWRRIFRARKWYPDKFPLRHTRRALAAAS